MAVDEMMHHQRYKQSAFLPYKAGRTVRDPSIDYVSTSMCIGFSEALGQARKPKPADDSKASLSAPAGEPGKPEDVLILIQNQSETLHIPHSAPKLRHETPQQTYTCKGRLLGTKLTNLKKAPTQPNNPNRLILNHDHLKSANAGTCKTNTTTHNPINIDTCPSHLYGYVCVLYCCIRTMRTLMPNGDTTSLDRLAS